MSARDGARAEAQQVAVAIAVQADAMAGGDDLGGQRRVAGDLLADEEERRPHAAVGEHLEHGRRALGVRAVVEGQGHPGPGRACGRRSPSGAPQRRRRRRPAPGTQ